MEPFQASRISVREALKRLEASGLIKIKPGSGIFVGDADSASLSESLSSFLCSWKTFISSFSPLPQKILKTLREKDSQKVYELMLNHIFEIQAGLKRIVPVAKSMERRISV
jgi:DNA-binding FadR family transcriptional regulator